MARKSGWQQFADNFNSVYGTFNKLGRNIESKRIMDQEEFFDEDNNPLTGLQADRARMRALADVYTKYGDAEGGLQLRTQAAQSEQAERDNELQRQIFNNQVNIQGSIAEALARAKVSNVDADTGLKKANTGLAGMKTNEIKTLLGPRYDLAVAQAEEAGYRADEAGVQAWLTNETKDRTLASTLLGLDARMATDQQTIDTAPSATDAAIAENKQTIDTAPSATDAAIAQNKQTIDTAPSATDAAIAQNEASTATAGLQEATANQSLNTLQSNADIIRDAMAQNFSTPAETQTYIENRIEQSNMPLADKQAALNTLNQIGIEKITNRMATITAEGEAAMQEGGPTALLEYYDSIDDGNTLRIEQDDAGNQVLIETRDGRENVLHRARGLQGMGDFLMSQIKNPGTALAVVADEAAILFQQAQTNTETKRSGLVNAQTLATTAGINLDNARGQLIAEQVKQVRQDVANSDMTDSEQAATDAYSRFLSGTGYANLVTDSPESARIAAKLVKYELGLVGEPPASFLNATVDGQPLTINDWIMLEDNERAQFQ